MKQMFQHWRKLGFCLIPYIDDFLFICSSLSEFTTARARVLSGFAQAGFVLSKEKCQLEGLESTSFSF
jgi:hypothetical protein